MIVSAMLALWGLTTLSFLLALGYTARDRGPIVTFGESPKNPQSFSPRAEACARANSRAERQLPQRWGQRRCSRWRRTRSSAIDSR